MEHVKFTEMQYGDREDYEFLRAHELEYAAQTGERLLDTLQLLESSMGGYQVSRLDHSLQSATRAYHDGADDDWIVSALLHDIADPFAPYNHDEMAATILKPFVREQCTWVIQVHGAFQKIYYADKIGENPNSRDRYRGHPYFDDCAEFCARWDQPAFDPAYPQESLDFFRPLVLDVFSRRAFDPAVLRPGARKALVHKANA
ncbi:MAG: peptidase [Pseudomonadota bacterium]